LSILSLDSLVDLGRTQVLELDRMQFSEEALQPIVYSDSQKMVSDEQAWSLR
jgi:hypothetical protein